MKVKTTISVAPVLEGALCMKGFGLIHKPWAMKYIEFYGLHKVIIYYKCNNNNEKIERRGSLKIANVEVITIDDNDKQYVFRVVVNKIKSNGTISSLKSELLLQALTESDMNKWMYTLNVYACSSRSSFLIDTLHKPLSLSSSHIHNNLYQYITSGFNNIIEEIFKEKDMNMIKLAMIFSNCITLFTNSIMIKKNLCKSMGQQIYELASIILDKDIYPLYNTISNNYIRKLKISLIEAEHHFRRLAEPGFLTIIIEESDENSDFYLYCSAIENLANDLCIAINHHVADHIMNINTNNIDDKLINDCKRIMISEDSLDAISTSDDLIKEFSAMIDCDIATVRNEVNYVKEKQKEIYNR